MFVFAFGEWMEVLEIKTTKHHGEELVISYWCKEDDSGKIATVFPCEVKAICQA
jgi:hypothetical protein